MTNKEEIEALGFRVFERHSIDGEGVKGFVARSIEPGPELRVSLEPNESEEDGLGRLLTLIESLN